MTLEMTIVGILKEYEWESDSDLVFAQNAMHKLVAHFLSLLPKEDELNNIICDLDKANEGNGAPCTEISKAILANIKERIEKEMV